MADETKENQDKVSFPDLNAVIGEQQNTIKLLEKEITKGSGSVFKEPIFNTTPTTTDEKPPNYILFIIIGVIIFLIVRGKK